MKLLQFKWRKDPANPVLPPVNNSLFDSQRCMNPFMVKNGDESRLYYSGGHQGCQRICLTISSANNPLVFRRHGVVLDVNNRKNNFDCSWCAFPLVHRFGTK